MNISVVIPVYKKTDMFLANLEKNMPHLEGCQIIIVNDDPDTSIGHLLGNWKGIELIENEKNLGFGSAVNKGIQQATKDYILLLNSDVKLQDASYTKALTHFENNKDIFAISFAQIEKDGTIVGKNRIYWQNGFFMHSRASDLTFGKTGWAEGGSCVIDLQKYKNLGGFDSLYSPFYWEDIDLSYRAWKRGYTILFDPEIVVQHHHESTIKSYFSDFYVNSIAYRNQLLFIWKNIDDPQLLREHALATIKQCMRSITSDPGFISGYWRALAKKSAIIKPSKSFFSDHEILTQFSD